MKKNYFTPEFSMITAEDTIRTSAEQFGYVEQGAGLDIDWGSAIPK